MKSFAVLLSGLGLPALVLASKSVEEMSVLAGLDSRTDLLTLKPVEFEHLIRELFEAKPSPGWEQHDIC